MRGNDNPNHNRAEPLTDAGGLGAGPGEVWQAEAGGGTLQKVSLLALEVYPAAHLFKESHTKCRESTQRKAKRRQA